MKHAVMRISYDDVTDQTDVHIAKTLDTVRLLDVAQDTILMLELFKNKEYEKLKKRSKKKHPQPLNSNKVLRDRKRNKPQ